MKGRSLGEHEVPGHSIHGSGWETTPKLGMNMTSEDPAGGGVCHVHDDVSIPKRDFLPDSE